MEQTTNSGFCAATGIFHSKRAPIVLPQDPYLSLTSFILQQTSRFHYDQPVYLSSSSNNSCVSHGLLRLQIHAAAAGLAQFGLLPGNVLLIVSPNSAQFAILSLAVLSLGAIITTCNPINQPSEISRQASDSRAQFVAAPRQILHKIAQLQLPLIILDEEVLLGEQQEHNGSPRKAPRCISFTTLISTDPNGIPQVRIRQDDVAALLYSSGTTGASKGVMLTHRNLISQAVMFITRSAGLHWSSRIYLCLIPMVHAYGFAIFCSAILATGCAVVILPKYDLVHMLAAIQKHRVTHLPLVPPILLALAQSSVVGNYDLSSLVQVSCGAAPTSAGTIAAFKARFPHVSVLQGYGLTESTATGANMLTAEESLHQISIGLLPPNMEAKIVDINTGKSLPPNMQGELWLRGPTIMRGYLGRPQETAATIDGEGWLHTGDIAYIDVDGYLILIDRLKEMIKYKAYQVAPAELEGVLLSHPQIVDAAVVPYPDDKVGQVPMAFIVVSHGSGLTDMDVINFVAEQVSPYKKIRRVAMVDRIPKSPSGKILRRELVIKAKSKL